MSLDAQAAFEAAVAPYRRELLVHCYRMLGSPHDAEDLLQETLLRAWRAADRYDASRSSLRTWLYRIATNACLNALQSARSRPLPSGVGEVFTDPDADFVPGTEVPWLVPLPADPEAGAVERSRLRIALVAALQLLPARQRAVLLLREALELPAAEVAAALDMSTAAVNSALQRARTRLAEEGVDPEGQAEPPAQQRAVVDRYVAAFERADVAAIVAMLADDVVMEMPPMWNWYRGRADYGGFMERVFRTRGTSWQTKPVWANGEAAFLCRRDGEPHSMQVATTSGDLITRLTVHADPAVFALFA
ncbi:RNA polymerase subunit sigma-70 [Nocardioides mangrovi]|uniref:RNA polymerase sigma factor n=1 Tax=Nocardioides mangrovi TaxID=2874580 RepID=A0ABS7U9U9_9ACTN|nr:RNA polymerase subunit sigma-70 [Nocardioides mangrovi]MBZ5737624.1 RNA polymerase subunit sigma-70 [Nocardioides mangrovi]